MQAAKLYNVEVWEGKRIKHTLPLNVPYAIAVTKRKELISKGTFNRNIWIVPAKTNNANTKAK